MQNNQNPNKKILIFELYTEEQSVKTISNLLRNKFYIHIITSELLIKSFDPTLDNIISVPRGKNYDFGKLANLIDDLNPDLIIFPRFSAYSYNEYLFIKSLTSKYKTLCGISNYSRWFSRIPLFYKIDFPYLSLNSIQDWFFCKFIISKFDSFFVSEIEIKSNNPAKKRLINHTQKHVFDIPFKINENNSIAREFTLEPNSSKVFVIPGKIQRKRRDYFAVLKIFMNKDFKDKAWSLYLLGKPEGFYGRKVIKFAKRINNSFENKKIFFYNDYVSDDFYEDILKSSHFLLAPTNKNTYKYGKDSGAIYDVLKYQKIGIFQESIFEHSSNLIKDSVVTYKTNTDLKKIITNIINSNFNTSISTTALNKAIVFLNSESYRKSLHDNVLRILEI